MAKHIRRRLSQMASLVIRLETTTLEDTNNRSVIKRIDEDLSNILIMIQEILRITFFKGRPISDLAALTQHDIILILTCLLISETIRNRIDIVFRTVTTKNQILTPARDCLTRSEPEIDILSRDSYQAFSIVDCLRSPEELEAITQMTSTFLALKTGQELEDSWPAHLIA